MATAIGWNSKLSAFRMRLTDSRGNLQYTGVEPDTLLLPTDAAGNIRTTEVTMWFIDETGIFMKGPVEVKSDSHFYNLDIPDEVMHSFTKSEMQHEFRNSRSEASQW